MLNINDEIWEQVTHIHEVSNFGNVRNINGNLLKPWVGTTGYYHIKVINNGVRKNVKLHRLVALAFIPNPCKKPHVNHIDGNKLNNHISNLEWCTHAENLKHAGNIGLISKKPRTTGQKLGKSSKYHNVSWDASRQKWIAGLTINGKSSKKRRFNTEEDAAMFVNQLIDEYNLRDRPRNIVN